MRAFSIISLLVAMLIGAVLYLRVIGVSPGTAGKPELTNTVKQAEKAVEDINESIRKTTEEAEKMMGE